MPVQRLNNDAEPGRAVRPNRHGCFKLTIGADLGDTIQEPRARVQPCSGVSPTNHLDMATKEMLVAALADFEGTMLFVSHDRHFLAALSNRVLELTPEGVHRYDGGYTEYVARTGQEAPGLHPGDSLRQ